MFFLQSGSIDTPFGACVDHFEVSVYGSELRQWRWESTGKSDEGGWWEDEDLYEGALLTEYRTLYALHISITARMAENSGYMESD